MSLNIFAKALSHRLLISFLNTSLTNTVKENWHLKNVITETNKRFKPLLTFLKILLIRVQTFMTSAGKGGGEVLKLVLCLHILLFLNSKSIIHFCGWGYEGGGGCHNCMILNIKTCFDKKVTLLALVLSWNSHPHFFI